MKTEEEIQKRLESPDNLCNLMKELESPKKENEDAEVSKEAPTGSEAEESSRQAETQDFNQDCCISTGKSDSETPQLVNVVLAPMYNGGRRDGDKNLTREEQVMVAALAHQDSVRNVAEAFDVSTSQVARLKTGITTHGNGKNRDLVEKVQTIKEKINGRVLDKLLKTEESILEEEIVSAPLKLKLEALKTLASVAEKTGDKEAPDSRKFVVFVPIERQVDHYGPAQDAPIKVGG